MKNEYTTLRATLNRLDEARAIHNRRASLNTGVISGGMDMSETGDEIMALIAKAEAIVTREIARGCRVSHIKMICKQYGSSQSIRAMIRDAEDEIEYQRQGY